MVASPALERLVDDLITDPLFAASRASKELFHTNVLGWIADHYPADFKNAFSAWLVPEPGRAGEPSRREWNDLDLVVQLADYRPLVIEAKVFALPREDQLAKYSDLLALQPLGPQVTALLLTLDRPGWTAKTFGSAGLTWTAAHFDLIAPALIAARGDSFDAEFIRREGRMLQRLGELQSMTELTEGSAPYFLGKDDRQILADHRLYLAVEKGRASQICRLIAGRLETAGAPKPSELVPDASNGEALVSGLWLDEHGDGVGWQLQGGSFRLALVNRSRAGRSPEARDDRKRCARRNTAWFDFDLASEVLGPGIGPARPAADFNRYDPDFVYRSISLPPDVTTDAVIELAVEYSTRAASYRFVP